VKIKMPDLESVQPGEEGEETPPSLETEESQELDDATFEPEIRIEETQSYQEAEVIEGALTELVSGTTDESERSEVPSGGILEGSEDKSGENISQQATEEMPTLPPDIPESEADTLPHTAVGKGPVPTFSPEFSDNQTEVAPESSPQTSQAVVDVVAKVLSDSQFREQFFSNPQEALTEFELTPDEHMALESLKEENVTDFASEFEKRDVSGDPPNEPMQASGEEQMNTLQPLKPELTDEDIQRLLGDKY
jgi:hypothetical protein